VWRDGRTTRKAGTLNARTGARSTLQASIKKKQMDESIEGRKGSFGEEVISWELTLRYVRKRSGTTKTEAGGGGREGEVHMLLGGSSPVRQKKMVTRSTYQKNFSNGSQKGTTKKGKPKGGKCADNLRGQKGELQTAGTMERGVQREDTLGEGPDPLH